MPMRFQSSKAGRVGLEALEIRGRAWKAGAMENPDTRAQFERGDAIMTAIQASVRIGPKLVTQAKEAICCYQQAYDAAPRAAQVAQARVLRQLAARVEQGRALSDALSKRLARERDARPQVGSLGGPDEIPGTVGGDGLSVDMSPKIRALLVKYKRGLPLKDFTKGGQPLKDFTKEGRKGAARLKDFQR